MTTTASYDRVKWHECVVELLSRSDAIADRDDDGRAVYYLFGWAGSVQFTDSRGQLTTVEACLGSVRMDGFSLLTKAELPADQIVIAEIECADGIERRIFAKIESAESAARHGKTFECSVIDRPEDIGENAIRLRMKQDFN
ncbi:MAG: hypothetical protein ACIAQF_04000 [Phycisphaerales bacterium JB065]